MQNFTAEDPSWLYKPGKYDFKEAVLDDKDTFGTEIIEKFKDYLDIVPEKGRPWTEEALQRIRQAPRSLQYSHYC